MRCELAGAQPSAHCTPGARVPESAGTPTLAQRLKQPRPHRGAICLSLLLFTSPCAASFDGDGQLSRSR